MRKKMAKSACGHTHATSPLMHESRDRESNRLFFDNCFCDKDLLY